MIRPLLAILPFLASPATADPLVADAFGLVPLSHMDTERAHWAGERLVDGQRDTVQPEAPDSVIIFVGPKSLVAGKDVGHAVALSTDRHGNHVADGIATSLRLGDDTRQATTRYGIADVLFQPSTKAAVYIASAEMSGRQSPRATVRVTADLASLGPARVNTPKPATRETIAALDTGPLTDRFGNLVEDGTAATLILQSKNEATFLPAQFLDGRASARLLLRDIEGGGAVSTTVASQSASGAGLTFAPLAYGEAPGVAAWSIEEINSLGIRIGPVTTTAGHLLNDGAPVTVIVTDDHGRTRGTEGWLRDGTFSATISLDPNGGPFAVVISTALGTVETKISAVSAATADRQEITE